MPPVDEPVGWPLWKVTEGPLLAVLGYSLLLKSRMVNNCLLADTGPHNSRQGV